MDLEPEQLDIVIVGAGICGLATALAFHRKGLKSVVLERSESLRSTGAAIGVLANGWRALEELGVASKLRKTADFIAGARDIVQGVAEEKISLLSNGEARCLIRSVLIETLAEELPQGTVRFGCQLVSIKFDPTTDLPVLQLVHGQTIKAKVLIGCDGANSVIGKFLNLKPIKAFSLSGIRGFTKYPSGHTFPREFVRIRRKEGSLCGRIPINSKLIYWFTALQDFSSPDAKPTLEVTSIKKLAIESTKNLPDEIVQIVANCDQDSLSLARLRYREPWNILTENFRKGTVTVAGDAMHVMGPFLGQGGSAALEDAVVLGRILSMKLNGQNQTHFYDDNVTIVTRVGEAIDEYVKERRMRLTWLSLQTYLIGLLMAKDTSFVMKPICLLLLKVLFKDPSDHDRYDCGCL